MKSIKYYPILILLLSPFANVANASSGEAPAIAQLFLLAVVLSIAVAVSISVSAFNKDQEPKPSLGSIILKGLKIFVGLSAAGWMILIIFFTVIFSKQG